MLRVLLASLTLALLAPDASAQSTPARSRKTAPYSVRSARRAPAVKINPHTGKPYGAGVSRDLRDGTSYLAPGMPMRRQVGYQGMGGYNDHRPRRVGINKSANSSLNRDNAALTASKSKRGRK